MCSTSSGIPERETAEGNWLQVRACIDRTSVHTRAPWFVSSIRFASSFDPQCEGQSGPAGTGGQDEGRACITAPFGPLSISSEEQGSRFQLSEEAKCFGADARLISLSKLWPNGPESAILLPPLWKMPQVDRDAVHVIGCAVTSPSASSIAMTSGDGDHGEYCQ